jgi:glycosyltransferase involved in cell wall biosynthesis
MTEPLVSIGLPVYNGERFLERAVNSVVEQTHRNWELLISDNGSSDRTADIAREFAERDPRVRFRAFDENQGAVANFEVVFRETTGPFFMWLAFDDWVAPTYLETCLGHLAGSPQSVLAFAAMNVVDDTSEPFRYRFEPIDGSDSAKARRRFHSMLWGLQDPTSAVFGLARREALEKTGLIRNSNEPDRILLGELSLLGRIHQDPERLFYHYAPKGHTNRDNWAWLNPRNRKGRRFATFRIVGHQCRAVWRGPHSLLDKLAMTLDLIAASVVKRVGGKTRAIKRQMASSRRSPRADSSQGA